METEKEGLSTIVNKILNNEILLPDFQRKFVWTDEEKQKRLVASVLAKMPIGSILLLKAEANDYAYKELGSKKKSIKNIMGKAEFLLDGQQRITVLANVFSSVLFAINKKPSELVNETALKKRFFLKIPEYDTLKKDNDIFGIKYLQFPYADVEQEPNFLTDDIYNMLKVKNFRANDKTRFNPYGSSDANINIDMTNECIGEEYLIPLFLLTDKSGSTKNEQLLNRILNSLVSFIKARIVNEFEEMISTSEQENFVFEVLQHEFFEMIPKGKIADINIFKEQLDAQADNWRNKFVQYLKSCVDKINLNQIIVEESQRDRAIDIYENLNRGGVSLSVFDLIMARVAKVYKDDFYQRIIECIQSRPNNGYPINVIPDTIVNYLQDTINANHYVASLQTKCLSDKGEINSEYIEVFLNVLCLKDNENYDFSVDHLKREKKLKMEAEFIDEYCDDVCVAIDRALYFFQIRCGVRTLKDIHYKLMFVIVAYLFLNEDTFKSKEVHNLLEAWYWITIFSGSFDSDQNSNAIDHLKKLIIIINNHEKRKDAILWLKNIGKDVLMKKNFSDKALWLYTNVEIADRVPKDFLNDIVCQFYLAKTYPDLLDTNERMTVFTQSSVTLEKHHIMPLGSAKNIGESTKKIRSNKKHYLNSPVNFMYLLPETNTKISDMDLRLYQQRVSSSSIQSLHFTNNDLLNEDDRLKWLENRFVYLHGELSNKIEALLPSCE